MGTGRPNHILAVDDEPERRALYAELFALEGYCVTARAALPDLDGLRGLRPDLLLLDYLDHLLGGVGGLVARLRADPALGGLPGLVCTAAEPRVRQDGPALAALGVGVVLKPFDLDGLLAEVGRRLAG